MTSYLELIIGPLFSGKTTYIINKYKSYVEENKKVLCIKPNIDNRFITNKIVTHNKDFIDCKTLNNLSEIDNNELKIYDVLIIDEGQFFSDLKETIIKFLDIYNLHIIICGLNCDYKKEKIGDILDLIPHSDQCIKLNSICIKCNNNTIAPFTNRIIKSNEQILIGGNDMYEPVCRKHHTF